VAEKIGMRFAGDGTYANGEACKAYRMTRDDFAAAYRETRDARAEREAPWRLRDMIFKRRDE